MGTPALAVIAFTMALLSGVCLGSRIYGTSCTQTCEGGFSCIETRCMCPFPDHQYYNYTAEECISFAKGPCSELVDGKVEEYPCITNAACSNATGIYECTCNAGFSPQKNGNATCMIAHGEACTGARECDRDAGLTCRNGKCRCRDYYEYSDQLQECRGLVGAKCDILNKDCYAGTVCKKGPWSFSRNDMTVDDWKQRFRYDPYRGTCQCEAYLKVMPNRKCTDG